MMQVDYWNQLGSKKTFNHPINFNILEKNLEKTARILDYGCGYGRVTKELKDYGYINVEGIDFSLGMIERGKENYPDLNLQVVSSANLPYPDNKFDAIILFTVLTCIPENEAQIKLIQELERVLKLGGLLYISDLCLQRDERNLKRYSEFADKYGVYGIFELPEGVTLRHHDMNWIISLISRFEQIFLEYFEVETISKSQNFFQGLCPFNH